MRIRNAAAGALLAMLAIDAAGAAEARTRLTQPSHFYVFGEFAHLDAPGIGMDGGGIGLGWHITQYLGIEGGGEYFRKTPLDLTNGHIEAMLSYPVTETFLIYASAGGAYVHGSANLGNGSITRQSSGPRVGLGVEHWFADHWGLRAAYHRQNAGGVADDLNIGVAFRF